MARFRCRYCCQEGEIEYLPGARSYLRCGSDDVQIAVSIAELQDDDPIFAAMQKLADGDD